MGHPPPRGPFVRRTRDRRPRSGVGGDDLGGGGGDRGGGGGGLRSAGRDVVPHGPRIQPRKRGRPVAAGDVAMNILDVRDLSVTLIRSSSEPVAALTDVSLTLQPGEILGLVGESGAGKTMLGRAI